MREGVVRMEAEFRERERERVRGEQVLQCWLSRGRRGLQAKDSRQPLEAGEGKASPLDSPE